MGAMAHVNRTSIFSEEKKVILFLTHDQPIEILDIKERGEDSSDLSVDLLERFYIQHK